jgi:hypothetical protein
MPQLIALLIGIVLYCAAVVAYFVYVVPFIAGGGAIAAIGIMLYVHGESLAGTVRKTPREQEDPEPAIKQYFFSAAWHELRVSIEKANAGAMTWTRNTFDRIRGIFVEPEFLTFPIGAGVFLAAAASVIVGYVVFGITIALHAIVLAVCFGVGGTVVGVLRLAELVSMGARRIYLVCASRDCHRRIALPLYRCPSCGAEHKSLVPGSYGAMRRRCECGEMLPTLFLLGRSRIPAFCPHESCGRPLNEVIGSARNVHIPVVGGPFVGKTAFLTAAMLEIKRHSTAAMTFPERGDQLAFDAAAERIAKGVTLEKTGGVSPNAMLIRVDDVREGQSLLYIYDAAGELYAGGGSMRNQNFFTHANAVAFLIDPFSLPGVRLNHAGELAAIEADIRASKELPQDVYSRLVMTLREQGAGSRINVPLAIIVTKIDAVGLEKEIESLGTALQAAPPPKEKKPVDPIREWLVRQGEGNLVQSAEHDFKRVRYFACSALGRMPSASTDAFVSRGVLTPFQWLAETNGVRLQ